MKRQRKLWGRGCKYPLQLLISQSFFPELTALFLHPLQLLWLLSSLPPMSFSLQSYTWYASPQYTSAVSHVSCNQVLKQYHSTLCGRLATTYLDGSLENSFNIFCMLSNLGIRNFVPRDIWQSFVSWIGDQKWKSQQLIPLSFSILVQLKGNNIVVIWRYL